MDDDTNEDKRDLIGLLQPPKYQTGVYVGRYIASVLAPMHQPW